MPLKAMAEFELPNSPTDGITRINFAPSSGSPLLCVSSWDKGVRLYDTSAGDNALRSTYYHNNAVLDCTFSDPNHIFSGGLDRSLESYDLMAQKQTSLGTHEEAIKCVEYCPSLGVITTGSWDRTLKIWDPRQHYAVGTYNQLGEQVYTMSLSGERLVVGTSGRRVLVWDLRNMQFAEQRRQSSLKYQTRCIKCFPNKQGFVLSSIEGRVAVEYFDTQQEVQQKKYAFKCHRIKEESVEKVYPVNAIAFHNVHNTFATGGSDGFVNIWDPFNKKRLCQFHRYPSDISSLCFSYDGTMIAIAVSPLLPEEGEDAPPQRDYVIVRHVSDGETQPK